jgi:hypothetical protein
LKQSPQYVFEYINERLINTGLTPSNFDPCLFMSTSLIVIVYLDDILIYGQRDEDITKLIKQLQKEVVALHCEGTAEGYLSIDIQWNGSQLTLLQQGLTKSIVKALGLDSKFSTPTDTPADTAALERC